MALYKSFIVVALLLIISFNGCTTHKNDGYYDRANKASEKALNKLDRE